MFIHQISQSLLFTSIHYIQTALAPSRHYFCTKITSLTHCRIFTTVAFMENIFKIGCLEWHITL